ncbi:MAG: T9SS type B sorting domain-containing protein [Bacteroidetes bacterium]|nr:T9SS type B sorting domain-containing protein [Bacteroidota bacterium]
MQSSSKIISRFFLFSLLFYFSITGACSQNLIQNGEFKESFCTIDTTTGRNNPTRWGFLYTDVWKTNITQKLECGKCTQADPAVFPCNIGLPHTGLFLCCGWVCTYRWCDPLKDSFATFVNLTYTHYLNEFHNAGYLGQKLNSPTLINHTYYFASYINCLNYFYQQDPNKPNYGEKYYDNPLGYKHISPSKIEVNTSYDAYGVCMSTNDLKLPEFSRVDGFQDSIIPTSLNQRKLRFRIEFDTVWNKLDGTFIADSNYRYITLGNFWKFKDINFSRPYDDSTTLPQKFFIDDLKLWDVTFHIKPVTDTFCPFEDFTLTSEFYSNGYTFWLNEQNDTLGYGDSIKLSLSSPGFIYATRVFPEIEFSVRDSMFVPVDEVKDKYSVDLISDTCFRPASFKVKSTENLQYTWNSVSGTDVYETSEDKPVELIAINSRGCSDTLLIPVSLKPRFSLQRNNDSCSLPALFTTSPDSLLYYWNGKSGVNTFSSQLPGSIEVVAENQSHCRDTLSIKILTPVSSIVRFESDSCSLPVLIRMSDDHLSYALDGQKTLDTFSIFSRGKHFILATDTTGCSLQIPLTINGCYKEDDVIWIPNCITPNADGNNDLFFPVGLNIQSYKLNIYNRWGEKIFESGENQKAWDGSYQNNIVPNGIYFYQSEIILLNGRIKNSSGTVHVLR